MFNIVKNTNVIFADGKRWITRYAKVITTGIDDGCQIFDVKARLKTAKIESCVARKDLICIFKNSKVIELDGTPACYGVSLLVDGTHMGATHAAFCLLLRKHIEIEHAVAVATKAHIRFIFGRRLRWCGHGARTHENRRC